uniref:Uncharacterized protein n=2 Tax=Ailuropoda melanoleuca TaxID=9646 RepID=A0A7N5K5I9_AILME
PGHSSARSSLGLAAPVRPSGRSPAAPEEASRPESPPPAPPSCVRYSGPSRRLRASSVISANALRTYRADPAHCHTQPLDYHSELPGFLRICSGISVSTSAPISSFPPPSHFPLPRSAFRARLFSSYRGFESNVLGSPRLWHNQNRSYSAISEPKAEALGRLGVWGWSGTGSAWAAGLAPLRVFGKHGSGGDSWSLSTFVTVFGCPVRGKGRMPLESSSSSMPPSFSSPLPSVPDSITNSSPPPMSYITSQEMKCILHWFASWSGPQRDRFLQDLVAKAVPGKLQPLLEGLEQLSVSGANRPPCIFECQLRLWDQWFRGWAEQERNEFVRQLEVSEPDFVAKFYQAVAATAGKD